MRSIESYTGTVGVDGIAVESPEIEFFPENEFEKPNNCQQVQAFLLELDTDKLQQFPLISNASIFASVQENEHLRLSFIVGDN